MKTYKVESITIEKKYRSVFVDATNRKEALKIVRSMSDKDFDELEDTRSYDQKVRADWSFSSFFESLFG